MKLPVVHIPSPLQLLRDPLLENTGIRLYLKRDDLIHPSISGNKWRKLRYNLEAAANAGSDALVTFGGAYSNHLYAVAAAGAALGLSTAGIVRGDELNESSSPTLQFCHRSGMALHFASRTEYRLKDKSTVFQKAAGAFRNPWLLPEGGTNALAVRGAAEIVAETNDQLSHMPDFFALAAGTGGTAAGLLSARANVIAFAALKGAAFLENEIRNQLPPSGPPGELTLQTDYHFGGYGKHTPELLSFIAHFEKRNGVALEQVYTGKMLFGLYDLIKRGYFAQGSVLVAVHTGGLQGRNTTKLAASCFN